MARKPLLVSAIFGTIIIMSIIFWRFSRMSSTPDAGTIQCLRVGIPQVYSNYDPSQLESTPQVFVVQILGGTLIRIGDNNEYFAAIAEKWLIEDDGKSFLFTISQTARFSDGTKITPADVVGSVKRFILFPGTHTNFREKILGADSLVSMQDTVIGLEEVGSNQVRIRTKKREPGFLAWLSFPEAMILPANEAHKRQGELNFAITSGAYFIRRHQGNSIYLDSNPYFYEPIGSAASCLTITAYPKVELATEALRSGQVDLLDYGAVLDPEFGKIISDTEHFSFTKGFSNALSYFILNPARPLFADRKNRQAFYRAFHGSKGMIPYGEHDIFFPASQFLPQTQAGYLTASQVETIQNFFERASEIEKVSAKMQILYPEVFGSKYQNMLATVIENSGLFEPQFQTYTEGNVLPALEKGDFDALFIIVGMGEKDTEILFDYHFGSKFPLYNFEDKTIRDSIRSAKMTDEKASKIAHYRAISEQLIKEAYITPVAHFSWPIIHTSKIYYERLNQFQMTNSIWRVSWR
jgi:ABC-type transport system substrate-binding protein